MIDGNTILSKKGFNDEESLLSADKITKTDSWKSLFFFWKQTKTVDKKDFSPSQDYQVPIKIENLSSLNKIGIHFYSKELCRQRMQSKLSPLTPMSNINDENTPGLSASPITGNSNTINSTPIRITGEAKCADSSRNSTW